MPISFRCPKCDQLLRVPDDAAGKKAKCPSCTEVTAVPNESTEPEVLPTPPPAARPSSPDFATNPYSSPTADDTGATDQYFSVGGPIDHQIIDAGNVLNITWAIFKRNMGVLVGAFAIILAISLVLGGLQQLAIFLMFGGGQQQGAPPDIQIVVVSNLLAIPGQLLQIFLAIGMARINLAAARGQSPDIGMLFSGGNKFLPILGASILMGLIAMLGFAACVIPGIFLACALWPFYYFILDRNVNVMDSFSQAWEYSKGNRLAAFLLGIIQFGIMVLGLLALCVGFLVAAPLCGLLWPVAYLQMTGQQVAHS
ncbi:MAG: hypothetical protein KDB27_10055 [Planctomycetales bacterium]|nr:hypothetical protein [Planctomycetales bacterium]